MAALSEVVSSGSAAAVLLDGDSEEAAVTEADPERVVDRDSELVLVSASASASASEAFVEVEVAELVASASAPAAVEVIVTAM